MKNSLVTSLFLISTLLLSGCGDSKEDTQAIPEGMASDPKQDATVEQPANVEEQIKDLPYNKFKLAIYTKENKDATVLAEFDKKDGETEAIYRNDYASTDLKGDPAFALLQPILIELQLNQEMSEEEVIQHVMNTFGAEDYSSFELEIDYVGGKEIKYNRTK